MYRARPQYLEPQEAENADPPRRPRPFRSTPGPPGSPRTSIRGSISPRTPVPASTPARATENVSTRPAGRAVQCRQPARIGWPPGGRGRTQAKSWEPRGWKQSLQPSNTSACQGTTLGPPGPGTSCSPSFHRPEARRPFSSSGPGRDHAKDG